MRSCQRRECFRMHLCMAVCIHSGALRLQVKFASRVNLSYVDQNSGLVEARGVPILSNWNRSCNLERLLQVMLNANI